MTSPARALLALRSRQGVLLKRRQATRLRVRIPASSVASARAREPVEALPASRDHSDLARRQGESEDAYRARLEALATELAAEREAREPAVVGWTEDLDREYARRIADAQAADREFGRLGVADSAGVERLVTAAGDRPPLAFRTVDELRELAAAQPNEWIVSGLLGRGAVTLLGAKPKVGKTTLVAAMLAACERGEAFADFATASASAVYLSEEPAGLLADRCRFFGVARAVFLAREDFDPAYSFTQFVEAGAAECERRGAAVLVLDTYARFARLARDAEKDAGATQAVMEAALAAAARGLAVLLITHLRKGDGDEGEAIRGSTALTGAADILLELRRSGDDLRELTCYSRYQESPTEPVLLRLVGDRFERVEAEEGAATSRDVEAAKTRILEALRAAGPLLKADLFERVRARAKARRKALEELVDVDNAVTKTGTGKKGDPHLYALGGPGGSQGGPGPPNKGARGGSHQDPTPFGGGSWDPPGPPARTKRVGAEVGPGHPEEVIEW